MTRNHSVRHAADRTMDGVRHAAEVMAPYAGTAKDSALQYAQQAGALARHQYDAYLAARVEQAFEQARGAVPPRVEHAMERAAKKTKVSAKQAADYTVPKMEHAFQTTRAAAGPAREEAVARGTAALAALRGQVSPKEIERLSRRRARRARAGRFAKRVTLLGLSAGAAYAVWTWWNKQTNPDWLVEPEPPTELSDRATMNGGRPTQSGIGTVDGSPADTLDPEVQAKQADADEEED